MFYASATCCALCLGCCRLGIFDFTWSWCAAADGSVCTARSSQAGCFDFDFGTISNPSVLALVPRASRGVFDMMVNRLVQEGKFSIIEGSKLDAVLREQNLGASDRVDASSAVAVGRILGVDLVMVGSVTHFEVQTCTSAGVLLWDLQCAVECPFGRYFYWGNCGYG
ncbi:MAG: CsgG/HfaB family protein [Thermostichales cyanobacterium SRBZ-1_bins_19]